MSFISSAIRLAERRPIPDALVRAGVNYLVARTRRRLSALPDDVGETFAADLAEEVIASHQECANRQHYELPADFFRLILGPRLKYSCGRYDGQTTTLSDAETHALEETVAHADLADGQRILELGCGWGSLSLFVAALYPNATILAVSNAKAQRDFIEAEARARGLTNITIVTADVVTFDPGARFDRIVSVEMFEHLSNWAAMLRRARSWLTPEGRLFIHVFSHRDAPYRYDHSKQDDWIAQHFFTGGLMPSHRLIHCFSDTFEVVREWRWSGRHYQRTAQDWLANFDANQEELEAILTDVYGADARLWRRRWRYFFMATAGLFGHADGEIWGVSHYRLAPAYG